MLHYIGEWGTEINSFIPYIYYLKSNNLLNDIVKTYQGMRSYYFFLDDHEIIFSNEPRHYVLPQNRTFLPEHLRNDDYLYLTFRENIDEWKQPNYRNYYINNIFLYQKPICIIQNKYNSEWSQGMKNYFSIEFLSKMFDLLNPKYQIIYFRTNESRIEGYSYDHNEDDSIVFEDDFDFIKINYPDVLIFQDIYEEYKYSFNFNTLKIMIFSNCYNFISVLGGNVHFSNCFNGNHLIYANYNPLGNTDIFYKNQHYHLCPKCNDDIFYVVEFYDQIIEKIKLYFINNDGIIIENNQSNDLLIENNNIIIKKKIKKNYKQKKFFIFIILFNIIILIILFIIIYKFKNISYKSSNI